MSICRLVVDWLAASFISQEKKEQYSRGAVMVRSIKDFLNGDMMKSRSLTSLSRFSCVKR